MRKVVGIDCISGLPREEVISSYVVNDGIMNCVNEIASEMKTFLERIPPQISYHIAKQGIFITGGSTRLPYLDKYLASYTGFTFNMSDLRAYGFIHLSAPDRYLFADNNPSSGYDSC